MITNNQTRIDPRDGERVRLIYDSRDKWKVQVITPSRNDLRVEEGGWYGNGEGISEENVLCIWSQIDEVSEVIQLLKEYE
jgi:hypothetical protein